ncbi:MAG: GTPase Era [Actinobacteria bacterium]|nr:GTPase Era [Actinomycetota bacterium]
MTDRPDSSSFRSGFVSVVGRPNVGKSTLVNRLVGSKVSIVSDRPQTTRTEVRGVRTTEANQIVFLDTPGVHKPRTLLGERTNERALITLREVDVVCFVVDASGPIGPGDRFVAARVVEAGSPTVAVVNKIDAASRGDVAHRLAQSARLGDFDAFVPVSAATGDGLDALLEEIEARLPEGPRYYPDGVVTDQPETFLVAELVREKLLAVAHDELPHSIAVTAEPIERGDGARGDVLAFRVVIRVERDSQKGIVIGRGGAVLKKAGTDARRELEALLGARVYLDSVVRVDRDWQRRPHALERLGF